MIKASDDYKRNIQEEMREQITSIVSIVVENKEALKSATIVLDKTQLSPICDRINDVLQHREVVKNFSMLENGSYVPSKPRPLYTPPAYVGIISNNVYDKAKAGVFFKYTIDIGISNYEIVNFKMEFGKNEQSVPKDFNIIFRNSAKQQIEKTQIRGNLKSLYSHDKPLGSVSKIDIEILSMSVEGVRFRLTDIILGDTITYTDELESTRTYFETSPLMSDIPIRTFSFNVIASDDRYNRENPNGIYKYFKYGQQVILKYRFRDEFIDGGKFFLDGSPVVDGKKIRFSATGRFQKITKEVEERSMTKTENYSKIIKDVCIENNVEIQGTEQLDKPPLDTMAKIDKQSGKQLITNVLNCTPFVLHEDVNSDLHVVKNDHSLHYDYKIPTKIMDGYPKYLSEDTPKLKEVRVKMYRQGEEWSETWRTLGVEGETLVFENKLIATMFEATQKVDTLVSFYSNIAKYQINYMGDPTIEVLDKILIDTQYMSNIPVQVISVDYTCPSTPNNNIVVLRTVM